MKLFRHHESINYWFLITACMVPKSNGCFLICVDLNSLNQYVKPIPRVGPAGRNDTKFDVSNGFWYKYRIKALNSIQNTLFQLVTD